MTIPCARRRLRAAALGLLGAATLTLAATAAPVAHAATPTWRALADGSAAGALAVAAAGDLNGDGVVDHVIGAAEATDGGRARAGLAWVVFGAPAGTPAAAVLDLNNLGTRGFRIGGAPAGARLGAAVAALGDIDGDGLDDVAIGAPGVAGGAGAVYVVYGAAGVPTPLQVTTPADRARRLGGVAAGEGVGSALAGGRDATGDGRPDLLIGAPGGRSGAGGAYLVAGWTGRPAGGGLGTPAVPVRAFWGQRGGDGAGAAVALVGDITRDGRAEIAIGAPGAERNGLPGSGAVHVLPGAPTTAGPRALGLRDGGEWSIAGGAARGWAGAALADVGDMDGDGLADLAIGAPGTAVQAGPDAGAVQVASGARLADGPLDLGGLVGRGIHLQGEVAGEAVGSSLAGLGDVNGDGLGDLLVGAPGMADGRGGALVAYGAPGSGGRGLGPGAPGAVRLVPPVAVPSFGASVAGRVPRGGAATLLLASPGTAALGPRVVAYAATDPALAGVATPANVPLPMAGSPPRRTVRPGVRRPLGPGVRLGPVLRLRSVAGRPTLVIGLRVPAAAGVRRVQAQLQQRGRWVALGTVAVPANGRLAGRRVRVRPALVRGQRAVRVRVRALATPTLRSTVSIPTRLAVPEAMRGGPVRVAPTPAPPSGAPEEDPPAGESGG